MTSKRRMVVLIICSSSLFMNSLDGTALNVALPAIQRNLHASVAGLQWIVDGFLLVLTSLLLISGSIADRFGRKRMFHFGLITFCLASLLCSLSSNQYMLIAFRMLQAAGGSFLVPTSLSIIRNTFTDARERARALGVWSGIFGIAAAAGPLIGGFLVDFVGWRSIFWINIPVGATALALSTRYVPESRAPQPRRFDPLGQLLALGVLATITYDIIEAPASGWTSPQTLGLFGLGFAFGFAFVRVELARPEPLLDMHFFRNRAFTGVMSTAVLVYLIYVGFLFVNTLYLQEVRGYSALMAGTAILPAMVLIALSGPISGRYMAHHGTNSLLIFSSATTCAGMLLLMRVSATTPYAYLACAYLLVGAGIGLVNTPITATAVASMPSSQAGVASACASSSRQLGSVLGVAIMGSLTTTGLHASLAASLSTHVSQERQVTLLRESTSTLVTNTQGSPELHSLVLNAFSQATHACWLAGAVASAIWAVVSITVARSSKNALGIGVHTEHVGHPDSPGAAARVDLAHNAAD